MISAGNRAFSFSLAAASATAALFLTTARGAAAPPACDPDNGGLKLPQGFCALVVANDLGAARHLAVAPNGDLYVSLMTGRGQTPGVVALRDTNGDGKMDVTERFGDKSTTGIALHNDYPLRRDDDVGRTLQDDEGRAEAGGGRRRSSRRICRSAGRTRTRGSPSTARDRST